MFRDYHHSGIGPISITADDAAIISVSFTDNVNLAPNPSSLTEKCKQQLKEYFSGKRKQFDLPLSNSGTPFQQSVYRALQTIPYGQTINYKQLAAKTSSPSAVRAAGNANKKNKLMIVVPCHRVIPSSGGIGGYAAGEGVKKWLLDFEKTNL